MDHRSALLECALRLFATQGYNAVGVQEIVEAAGVTKPTLYHYFGSKRGVLETLLAESSASLLRSLQAALPYQGDLTRTLEALAGALFDFARHQPQVYRLLLSLSFAPPDSIPAQAARPQRLKLQRLLEEVFQQAAHDHGNMTGRHTAYAATFLGMLHTYISLSCTDAVTLDDQLVYQAVHQFQHGIYS